MFDVIETGRRLGRDDLLRLERNLSVKLLPEYGEFLLRFNGGRPVPGFFPIRGMDLNPFGAVHELFGVDLPISSSNIDWNFDVLKNRIPRGLLPIADTGTGDVLCLSLEGHNRGAVYLWNHEAEHAPPTYDNLYLIAETWPAFLDSLHERDLSAEVAKIRGKVVKRPH